jgi:hypothetical protein
MPQIDIGSETYDVFADLDFADPFLAGDVMRAGPWATRNDDAKGRGLVSATRMLLSLPWCDEVPGFDDAPAVVQEVTSMLASDLLAKPKLFADATGNSNVKSAKAGSASVEFFSPVSGGPPIPTSLWNMLLNAGLMCPGKLGDGTLEGAIVTGILGGCRPLGGRYPWDWPIASADYD